MNITPLSSTSPATFTITGKVAYGPFGSQIVIPLTATAGNSTVATTLTLTLVPEPATLIFIAAAPMLLHRRGYRAAFGNAF